MNGTQERENAGVEISVVCYVGAYFDDLAAVHREFREAFARTGRSVEFLYVLDGPRPRAEERLATVTENRFPLRIFRMARGFGEAAALQYAFDRARGRYVVTIPARFQVEPRAVHNILARLDHGEEVVVTRREPRKDAWLNRLQSRVFHALIRRLAGRVFHDVSCGLRGLTAEVASRLDLYGDLDRFIPIIAARRGFRVAEIPATQRPEDLSLRIFGPGVYARRLLDLLNVFFLTRFTRKPLRFFGLIGMVIGAAGFVICVALAGLRLFGEAELADRPLLLLGVLLVVLGVQVTSIGLIGEIILSLSARRESPEVREIDRNES